MNYQEPKLTKDEICEKYFFRKMSCEGLEPLSINIIKSNYLNSKAFKNSNDYGICK